MAIEIDPRITPLAERVNAVLKYEGDRPEDLNFEDATQALKDLFILANEEAGKTGDESWFSAHSLTAIGLSYWRDGHNPSGRYYASVKARDILTVLEQGYTMKDFLSRPLIHRLGWEIRLPENVVNYAESQRPNQ